MSILIKGMKMPKDDVCAFKQITITNNWIDGEVIMLAHYSITNEFIGEVVEIPEPHGKLIDADALPVKDLDSNGWLNAFGVAVEDLEDAPTVIEAEGQ